MDRAFKKCEVVPPTNPVCSYLCSATVQATMYNNETTKKDAGTVQSSTVGLNNMRGDGGIIKDGLCVAQIVPNSPLCGPGTKVGSGDHAGKCVVDLDAVCGGFLLKDAANHQCLNDERGVSNPTPPPPINDPRLGRG